MIEIDSLKRQMRSGACNFFWIASLSMTTSVIFIFSTRATFVVGLGITQFMDTVVYNFSLSNPGSMLVIRLLGLIPNLFICGVFALCGVLALRGHLWAFIAGIILYGLDTILTFISPDIIGFGFHLFFLWFIFIGLQACNRLEKVKRTAISNSREI